MAVPKRRMSRSNTRSRRSNWKATAPALVSCPQCHEPKLPTWPARPAARTGGARSSTRPEERGGRESGLGRSGRRAGSRRAPARPWRADHAQIARARADPPLVRLRERRPAHQRAAGVPRRLGARAGRDRHAVPRLPEHARGAAGQAARRGGPDARAGRCGQGAEPGLLHQARPRRGGHRRPEQVVDPGRHAGGGHRRGVHRLRPGRGRRPGPPAVRPGHRPARPAWAPGWTGRRRCRS